MAGYGLNKRCRRCRKRLSNDNETGRCRACLIRQSRADGLKQSQRLATNRATPHDLLLRENTELRHSLATATRTLEGHTKQRRFEDRLLTEVRDFIDKSPYRPQLRPYVARPSGTSATRHEMLAHLSDAHYPEVVEPEAAFGLKYNADICRRRLEHVRDTILRYADLRRASYPVGKLTVNVNGDMLSGEQHPELEVTNQHPMTEALVKMAYMLLDMGTAFAESFPAVEFIVMPGNHPRIQKVPRFKQKWNNWEWLMGQYLKALAGDRFTVTVPKDLVYRFTMCGRRIGVTHGDGQKVQSYAGIPFYGMEKRRTKLQALLKQLGMPQLDVLCYAHFHQMLYDEGQGVSMFINGSCKGGDEYSIGTSYGAQAPVQGLMTFHPKHGLTDLSRINLGHIM